MLLNSMDIQQELRAAKSKPGSRVTTESCWIGVRNDLMLGEWRSWEIGTANTAKRREIVERSPGRRDEICWARRGPAGAVIAGVEDEGGGEREPT